MIENLWTHGQHAIDAWKSAPLPDLITHIVEHYHLEARVEMARLENLAEEAVLLGDGEPAGIPGPHLPGDPGAVPADPVTGQLR